ncbi:MAG: CocE/NonD family hydrolase [Bacteroidales bacterium]|nr:CocE/NonD family hydrolase [Bacteroidales bacterium]
MRTIISFCLTLFLMISCSNEIVIDQQWLDDNYTKREVMIPMRDGVKLYTSIYTPDDADDRPILIVRTPYSCAPYGDGWKGDLTEYMQEFLENSYIIVFQDVRGRYMSEGQFVNVRPYIPEKSELQTDDATDTYDTIEWLVNNTDNNGSVGVTGMSYPGFYATMAALSAHPTLKAVSPQAPILDWFKGDDIHHNGALMLMDIYSFAPYMFKKHDNPVAEDHGLPSPIGENAYDWYLKMKTLPDLTAALPDTLEFWNEILQHPHYDEYWKERSLEQHLHDIKPAILVVGGSYDTDDCYGALNTYKLIRDESPETNLHFVYGPWTHGGWHQADYEGLGDIKFAKGLSSHFMKNIEYPFFRYYLEGKGKKPEPVYIATSGSDKWQTMNVWPAEELIYTPLYLNEGSVLSFDPETVENSVSSYCSDPSSPVPFVKNPTHRESSYMVADQTFASERADVLTFTGVPQEETLRLQGPVKVDLNMSISTDDADLVIKLIDVYPDGYQMLIRMDFFPVRYRESLVEPKPAIPGDVMNLQFTMNDVAHWVLPGHRLMVQIQSSCFPLVNMNPQTYMDNIYKAAPEDYVKSDIRIYHQKDLQSRIFLPVI